MEVRESQRLGGAKLENRNHSVKAALVGDTGCGVRGVPSPRHGEGHPRELGGWRPRGRPQRHQGLQLEGSGGLLRHPSRLANPRRDSGREDSERGRPHPHRQGRDPHRCRRLRGDALGLRPELSGPGPHSEGEPEPRGGRVRERGEGRGAGRLPPVLEVGARAQGPPGDLLLSGNLTAPAAARRQAKGLVDGSDQSRAQSSWERSATRCGRTRWC